MKIILIISKNNNNNNQTHNNNCKISNLNNKTLMGINLKIL